MDIPLRALKELLKSEYSQLEGYLQDSASQVARISRMKKEGSADPHKRDIFSLRQLEAEREITALQIRTCEARIERFKLEIELLG